MKCYLKNKNKLSLKGYWNKCNGSQELCNLCLGSTSPHTNATISRHLFGQLSLRGTEISAEEVYQSHRCEGICHRIWNHDLCVFATLNAARKPCRRNRRQRTAADWFAAWPCDVMIDAQLESEPLKFSYVFQIQLDM